jgi:hypothetical protein
MGAGSRRGGISQTPGCPVLSAAVGRELLSLVTYCRVEAVVEHLVNTESTVDGPHC